MWSPSSGGSLRFLAVDAEPDNCDLCAPLKLSWRYAAAEDIPEGCVWVVSYVFDVVEHAREARLGRLACAPAASGSVHEALFSCDRVDVTDVPERCVRECCVTKRDR